MTDTNYVAIAETERTEPEYFTELRLRLIEQTAEIGYQTIRDNPDPQIIKDIRDMLYVLGCPIEQ